LGTKNENLQVEEAGWKEGEGSWCCTLRIAFSRCLPRLDSYSSKFQTQRWI